MSAFGLPNELLVLFQARPFSEKPKVTGRRYSHNVGGLAKYIHLFNDYRNTDENTKPKTNQDDPKVTEKPTDNLNQNREQNLLIYRNQLNNDTKMTGDYRATIFLARLNYTTTSKTLDTIFSAYGPIKMIRIVHDRSDRPRGYAFIEFQHETDAKKLLMDKSKDSIDGRNIIIDKERGRAQVNWLPRRFGGGLGSLRRVLHPKAVLRAVKRRRKKMVRVDPVNVTKRNVRPNFNDRKPYKRGRNQSFDR